jgi:hypothetical protein
VLAGVVGAVASDAESMAVFPLQLERFRKSQPERRLEVGPRPHHAQAAEGRVNDI